MKHRKGCKRSSPWVRVPAFNQDHYTPDVRYYMENLYDKRPKFSRIEENRHLDIHTKRAALRVSPSVVSLISYIGEKELNQGSGIIIECGDNYAGIILTSADLIRCRDEEKVAGNILPSQFKVVVRLSDGRSCDGEVCAYDFHYNIAAVSFKSDSVLSTAVVRHVDDSLGVNPSQLIVSKETSFQLKRHSSSMNLTPGTAVIAVGRYFAKPYDLMGAPGVFSLHRCRYDCKELFMATCRMTECGSGGPLVNSSGEVIGIAFYDNGFTPFLPMNVAYKWWEHYKKYGELRRPSLGMEAVGFHSANLDILENIIQRFPSISKGVIVEKVMSGSSADCAGLRVNDVIVECSGKVVQSFLELFEIVWDNVGHPVELVVARPGHVTPLHLQVMFVNTKTDELNRWRFWE